MTMPHHCGLNWIGMFLMQFTVNLTTAAMARATDWCGVRRPFYARAAHTFDASALDDVEGIRASVGRFLDAFMR